MLNPWIILAVVLAIVGAGGGGFASGHHFGTAAQKVADQHLPVEYLVIALDSVLAVQHGLWMLGYNPGPQDGGDGPKTQAGVRSFQTAVGLPANGAWNDPATRMELAGALASDGWTIAG